MQSPGADESMTGYTRNGVPEMLEGLLGQLVFRALDVIIITEADPLDEPGPRIVYVNEAFTRLTGYEPEEVLGRSPRFLQNPTSTDPGTRQRVRKALEDGAPFDGAILNYGKDGTEYWLDMHIFPLVDATGRITHFAAIERDISAEVTQLNEWKLKALVDPLTGLLNRRGFEVVAQEVWRNSPTPGGAVISLDVDNFKAVNDTRGHPFGDRLLAGLGSALRNSARRQDIACRTGGDEFVVVLPAAHIEAATAIAHRIRLNIPSALASVTAEHPVAVTVSVGVATGDDAADLDSVLAAADRALYDAKESGRDRLVVAAPE